MVRRETVPPHRTSRGQGSLRRHRPLDTWGVHMAQDALVTVNLVAGWRLITALHEDGFSISVAFWAQLVDENEWTLYIASPIVTEKGPLASYRQLRSIRTDALDRGIDSLSVNLLGSDNPIAKAAADVVQPRSASEQGGVLKAKESIIPYRGHSLGGMQIEAAFIYPPWKPALNPLGLSEVSC